MSKISTEISIPVKTAYKSKIIGNIAGNATLKKISIPTNGNNGRTLLIENETYWSGPLQQNATYIEGSFRIITIRMKRVKTSTQVWFGKKEIIRRIMHSYEVEK